MALARYFSHGVGILVHTLGALETLASSALLTITLPKLAHDVCSIGAFFDSGIKARETDFVATVVAETIASTVITPAYVVIQATATGFLPGAKIVVQVVL